MTHAQSNVLFFKTNACGVCRKMEPFVEDFDVQIINLNFGPNRGYVEKYGLHSVPTTIVLDDNGNEIKRKTGGMTKQDFEQFIA